MDNNDQMRHGKQSGPALLHFPLPMVPAGREIHLLGRRMYLDSYETRSSYTAKQIMIFKQYQCKQRQVSHVLSAARRLSRWEGNFNLIAKADPSNPQHAIQIRSEVRGQCLK